MFAPACHPRAPWSAACLPRGLALSAFRSILILLAFPAAAAAAAAADHRIKLAYFVPQDRTPVAQYAQKIRVVMAMVTELYAQDLRAKGYTTQGLRFESGTQEPVIHLVQGKRAAQYYNNAPRYDANEQWRRLTPEIRSAAGSPQQHVIVVFADTCDDGPAEHLWPGVIARGAYHNADGGLAVFSAHLLRDPFSATTVPELRKRISDRRPVQGRKAWGHAMNSPLGEFVEDGIGAVAHELGHALGLPHDRRADNFDIMGNGFRNLRWNLDPLSSRRISFSQENARLLMSSRYLASDLDLTDDQPARVEVKALASRNGSLSVSVKASDNTGLRALVLFDRRAGTVLGGRELEGKTQEVRQELKARNSNAEIDLQVIVTDDGGNQTRATPMLPR